MTAPSDGQGSYDEVAAEYYDPLAHPTCANLGEASALAVSSLASNLVDVFSTWCEVGAGRSVVLDLMSTGSWPLAEPAHLLLVDSSRAMLGDTDQERGDTPTSRVIADVHSLPVSDSSLDCVIASLGDPYNDESFWSTLSTKVRPGGMVIFTTPSFDWAQHFRRLEGAPADVSRFVLRSGKVVDLPSFIVDRSRQLSIMEDAGFDQQSYVRIPTLDLHSPLSSKLAGVGIVLDGYLAERRR